MTDFTDMNDCEFYKLGRNTMRIETNVKAALKTIAAKGVVVPPDANSDDLANLIAKIPTSTVPIVRCKECKHASTFNGVYHDKITAIQAKTISTTTTDEEAQ